MSDANDLLMSGGVPAAKFPEIGSSITGRILREPEARDQTDFTTGAVLRWDNGEPKKQIIVQLATNQRDPQNPSDDGTRTVYVKGNMINAVRQAVRAAGAPGLVAGGTLTVTYAGDGKASKPGLNAPKLYTAAYQAPDARVANDLLMGGNGNGQQPTSPPVAQPVTNGFALPPAVTQEPPLGVDPAVWAVLSAEQRATVLAAATNR